MQALAADPTLDTADWMQKKGWLDLQDVNYLRQEATGYILQTAASMGWLSPEQVTAATDAHSADGNHSTYDFLYQQGWLTMEQVAWLQQNEATQGAPAQTAATPVEAAPAEQ